MARRWSPTAAALASTAAVVAALALAGLARSWVAGLIELMLVTIAAAGARRAAALERQLAELRSERRDRATGLGTQTGFAEDLDREILRADRSGQPLCLVVVRLDSEPWMQRIDELVRIAMAQAIVPALRRVDLGYRIGANEFALILPDTRARGGLVAARRVADALHAVGSPAGPISVGVAEGGPGIDRRMMFRNAYVALLAATREDRDDVIAYAPELEPAGREPG